MGEVGWTFKVIWLTILVRSCTGYQKLLKTKVIIGILIRD